MVLRRRGRHVVGGLVALAMLLAGCYFALLDPGVQPAPLARCTVFSLVVFGAWLVWKGAVHPRVVLTADGLVVRNVWQVLSIPATRVVRLVSDDELEIVLDDGRRIPVSAYARTPLGVRAAHAVAETIAGHLRGITAADAGEPAVRRRANLGLLDAFGVLPVLVCLVTIGALRSH